MGYQNGSRPRNLDNKLADVLFDLSDLCEDSKPEYANKIGRKDLHDALLFVHETLAQYCAGISRRNRRKKK